MKSERRSKSILTALLFVALSAGLVFAQDQDSYPAPPASADASAQQGYPAQPDQGAQQQQQDPPGRVAQVEYMSGEVSIQPGGVNDWIAASQNRPLTTSDRIWTDKEARAELNVGDGFIRMNSETSLTLTNITDNNIQLELDQGILELTVRHLSPGEIYEVDTPNYAFTVTKSGVYRFDVYPSEDQSWVTVRSGSGEATGQGQAVRVNSGTQMRFTSGTSLQHTAEGAPQRDGFDDWAQVRDKRLEDSVSARYVSPGVIGYQNLDQYGSWQPTPAYGNVWVPNSVPVGWAPYRYGHWVWIAPWGWTWVDDAPWGFAPFHYGRWVSWGGGWAWAPGPVGYWQPYYAPALVGWIGGPGFGVGFGFGGGFSIGINFGWFPLGWGEPFYPRYCGWGHGGWYRGGGYVSNAYFRNVNVTNTRIVNINNVTNNYYRGNVAATHYGFRNTAGAVTAAPKSAFTSGAAINRVGGAVPRSGLNQGAVLRGVDANPTRQSVLGGRSPQTHGVPPASAFNRSVVTANNNRPVNARPANLEAANQATLSHGNQNTLSHGGPATNNVGRPGPAAPNTEGRVNAPGNTRPGEPAANHGVQPRGPATAGTEARVDNTPTSMGGHYVPRPPSAGGLPSSNVHAGTATPNANHGGAVNTPHTQTGNYGRTTAPGASSAENHGPATYGNQHYGTPNSNVARPPQSYQPSHPTTAEPQHSAPSHNSAPSSSGSKGSSPHGSGTAYSVPRPSPSYSYHPAPTYSASAGYGAGRPASSGYYGGSSRSTYSSAPSYSAGRSSIPSYSPSRSIPNYTAPSRTYSAAPAYRAAPSYTPGRSYGASPTYSARNTGSYSAPHASGGGAYRAPSAGGSRGGGGGGAHYSGGGSHASGGGGGHHGR